MFKKIRKWFKPKTKSKVGRPKLANKDLKKSAKLELAMAFVLCAILVLSGTSVLTGKSPLELLSFGVAGKASGSLSAEISSPEYKLICDGVEYGVYRIRSNVSAITASDNFLVYGQNGKLVTNPSAQSTWVKSPVIRKGYKVSDLSKISKLSLTINDCTTNLNISTVLNSKTMYIFLKINKASYIKRTPIKLNLLAVEEGKIIVPETATTQVNIDNGVAPQIVQMEYVKPHPLLNSVNAIYVNIEDDAIPRIESSGTIKAVLYNDTTNQKLMESTNKSYLIGYNTGTSIFSQTIVSILLIKQESSDVFESILENNKNYRMEVTATDRVGNVSNKGIYRFYTDDRGYGYPITSAVATTRPMITNTTTVTTTSADNILGGSGKKFGNIKIDIYQTHKSPVEYLTRVQFMTVFRYEKLPSNGGDQYYRKFVQYYINSSNKIITMSGTDESNSNVCTIIPEKSSFLTYTSMYISQKKMFGRWLIYKDSGCRSMVGYINTPLFEYR